MSTPKKNTPVFLMTASTYWVTLVRLGLIVLSSFDSSIPFMDMFYFSSFVSIMARPHVSLPHLEEAHAIWTLTSNESAKDFSSFYAASDSVRIPPLILAVFSWFTETTGSNFELWFSLLLLLIDILIAYLIEQIGIRLLNSQLSDESNIPTQPNRPSKEEEDLQRKLSERVQPQYAHIFPVHLFDEQGKEPSIRLESLPLLSAQLYFWSPFTALPSTLFFCWQNVSSLFLVASVYQSMENSFGSFSMASLYLAVATYLEPHHIAYVVPVILLSSANDANRFPPSLKIAKSAFFVMISFALWSVLLHQSSSNLVGPENYRRILGIVYGNTWLTTTPNLSLQWYFRMQIFSRFRDYFGFIYAGIPFVLIGPLCLRFFRYPAVMIAIFAMVWTIYRPVQVLYDANFAFCFFLFCPQSLARMGYAAFIALCCIMVPLILNIVDHWMWLDANNGNANYIFFQCLAYNVFLGVILGQFTSASMQHDKVLRLKQKRKLE